MVYNGYMIYKEAIFWQKKSPGTMLFFSIRTVNTSPATRVSRKKSLTVCSVTVLSTVWERPAAAITNTPKTGSKTARNASFPTRGTIIPESSSASQRSGKRQKRKNYRNPDHIHHVQTFGSSFFSSVSVRSYASS